MQYIKQNNYTLGGIYIDDGYSGSNFNRPDYKRLIDDVEAGKINMVITKDMSRLGRDYIEVGNLIENYFVTTGDWNFGSAVSLIMTVVILVSMYFTKKFDYDKEAA